MAAAAAEVVQRWLRDQEALAEMLRTMPEVEAAVPGRVLPEARAVILAAAAEAAEVVQAAGMVVLVEEAVAAATLAKAAPEVMEAVAAQELQAEAEQALYLWVEAGVQQILEEAAAEPVLGEPYLSVHRVLLSSIRSL